MTTQELKSVTIRVPTDLLELIGARVSDRDTRTDVIINLLRQALKQPIIKTEINISDVEQKISEVNQRVDDLVESLNNVRQQITSLDTKPNNDLAEWIKQIKSFESRLSTVEKTKTNADINGQLPLDLGTKIAVEVADNDAPQVPLIVNTNPITEQSTSSITEVQNELSVKLLAKRLSINSKTISTKKKEKPKEEVYNWLQGKDPDKISWKPVGGDLNERVTGWIPDKDTPSELLNRLQEWIVANSD